MRFLIDANLPITVRQVLTPHGSAVHVREVGLAAAPDSAIIGFARRGRMVLVTRDLDFGNPILYPPKAHHGVIILRLPSSWSVHRISATLSRGLEIINDTDLDHDVVVIEPARIRIRRPHPR